MKQYLDAIIDILINGDDFFIDGCVSEVVSKAGVVEEYNMLDGSIPILTTREINYIDWTHELILTLRRNNDLNYLKNNSDQLFNRLLSNGYLLSENPHAWKGKLDKLINELKIDIELGIFSKRKYIMTLDDSRHHEFFINVINLDGHELEKIKEYRNRRKEILGEVDDRPLPKYKLNSYLSIRSNDIILEGSRDTYHYSILNHIISHVLNCHPGKHVNITNDAYINRQHIDSILEQMERRPHSPPKLYISSDLDLDKLLDNANEITIDMFKVVGYEHHPHISFTSED